MPNGTTRMAGTVSHIGRRAWECKGDCQKDPKDPNATFWNNATKLECKICGFEPSPKCRLWGDGKGVKGGRWKKDNGVPPPAKPSTPSVQTAVGKAATEKRMAAADNKQAEKLRKLELEKEALQQKSGQARSWARQGSG